MKTRFWSSDRGSTTCVQYREDTERKVWMHTNLGWVAPGYELDEGQTDEQFAEELARGYELTERDEEFARYMAGWDEDPVTEDLTDRPDYHLSDY